MDNQLYEMIDQAGVEEIIYSECSRVQDILGAKKIDGKILVQAYVPDATALNIFTTKSASPKAMEMIDESGFFAILLNKKDLSKYELQAIYKDGNKHRFYDPYAFESIYSDDDIHYFGNGVHYEIYNKMGAHKLTRNGISGVNFSVYAPAALRVSVVGNFNNWDGRKHQMKQVNNSGIYELFIPGIDEGEIYKYEIKNIKGDALYKCDPYAFSSELRPDNASIVTDLNGYEWSDKEWLKQLDKKTKSAKNGKESPMNIYEVHLGSFMQNELKYDETDEYINGSEFMNYKDIAKKLAAYVKKMGYTHVELMPIMEHPLDESWGYQVTGYYSPSSRYGSPKDFMYFVDYMHQNDIGVIIDWVPAHFPKDAHGLASFDGSQVYEHCDPKQGMHPHWGTLIYNYGRPQVSNFLIANALYWADYYHIDGIRMDAVASMLYLDYGKNDGEWVANKYGGKENIEAIEFLKHLNSILKQRFPNVMSIAEESTAWPKVSGDLNDGGLGFDYKWNMGWMNDFLRYMSYDPIYRSHHYNEITFSMMYQYSENFILVISHDEVVHGKGSLVGKMPGYTWEEKFANLRAAYGFMMTHPGKKLLFMGQEFGQCDEWYEKVQLEWELLNYPVHKTLQEYTKTLNNLYINSPALWECDSSPEGFTWVDCKSYQENILAYIRSSKDDKQQYFVVCNFTPVSHNNFEFTLPFAAKLKLLLNSDNKKFGGNGKMRITGCKTVLKNEEHKLKLNIPGMSSLIFEIEKVGGKE